MKCQMLAYGGTSSDIIMQKVKQVDVMYAMKNKTQNGAILCLKHRGDDDTWR